MRAINAELLEALKGLFAVLEPEIPGSPDSPLERARAAIAKAEGGVMELTFERLRLILKDGEFVVRVEGGDLDAEVVVRIAETAST